MKAKKLFLPTLILIIAVLVMIVSSLVSNIAQAPTISQHDFPFSITYELNGTTETIEGVYSAEFTGNGGYVDSTARIYEGKIISQREDIDTSFVLSETDEHSISLHTNFFADYLMGDAAYDYFSYEPFAPSLTYYSYADEMEYYDEQELQERGVKLVSWEYPEPIENSFVFSHFSYMTGENVVPMVIIAALALLAVLIFVKKDQTLIKKKTDTIAVIFNFLIAFIAVPFLTICGILIDITGSSPALSSQLMYATPAIAVLGLAASVSLRRKGFRKSGFIVQFAGLAVFSIVYLYSAIESMLS